MKEVEIKAKAPDADALKRKLEEKGCEFSEPAVQKDRIYLHEDTSFPEITRGTVILRIRETKGKHILTLKKQLGNELDNIEREVTVDDPDQAEDILTHMDYREAVRVRKTRTTCSYKDMEICIDEVDRLGTFIEVEKMTEEDSATVQEELFSFLETLGVRKEDQVHKGYDTLTYELNHKDL